MSPTSSVAHHDPFSLHAALRQVRDQLAALASRGQRPLLVVDDAHLIESVSTFEAVRLLLNFATNGPPDLSLLFVGDAEVLLDFPRAWPTGWPLRCLLAPLAEAESSSTSWADSPPRGPVNRSFQPRRSGALTSRRWPAPPPNHLADLALLIAYAQELSIVDASIVTIAAREFSRDVAA